MPLLCLPPLFRSSSLPPLPSITGPECHVPTRDDTLLSAQSVVIMASALVPGNPGARRRRHPLPHCSYKDLQTCCMRISRTYALPLAQAGTVHSAPPRSCFHLGCVVRMATWNLLVALIRALGLQHRQWCSFRPRTLLVYVRPGHQCRPGSCNHCRGNW
eukprot:SM000064S19751  [mRNA]  locus=s64:193537:194013:- [translate_table: standard]